MRSSPWLLCWLLAGPCLSLPGVPIYCRRFKGDCRRSQSTCCLFLDKSTPAPTTTTTSNPVDNLEEYVDELEFSDGGDPLDAQPSYVEEVFVKPSLEEFNLVEEPEDPPPSAQERSSQSLPGFCSIFKIRCSTRPGHQCCRNKAEEELEVSSSQRNGILGPDDRQTTKEEQKAEGNEESNLSKQDEDLTNEEQKSKFSIPVKSKYAGRSKSRNFFNRKPKPTKNPKPLSSTTVSTTTSPPEKKKPISSLKNKLKSSLFGRRPRSFDPRKSALCRIVNCGRSPQHKCCIQKEEEQPPFTTTTEAALTETTQESSTFEIIALSDEDIHEDIRTTESIITEDSSKEHLATINSIFKEEYIYPTTVHPENIEADTEASVSEAVKEGSVGEEDDESSFDEAEEVDSVGEEEEEGPLNDKLEEGSVGKADEEGSVIEAEEDSSVSRVEEVVPVGEVVRDGPVNEALKDGPIGKAGKVESVGEAVEEGSVSEAVREGSIDEVLEDGSGGDAAHEEGSVSEISEKEGSSEGDSSTESVDISGGDETTEVSVETLAEEDINAAKEIPAREEIHPIKEIYNDKETITTTAETLDSFLATYSTTQVPEVTQRVIAPVYVPAWRQRQEEKEEEEIIRRKEEKRLRQEADIISQKAIFQLPNAPSMMYTEIDNSLDPNGMGDSETDEEDDDNSVGSEDDWSSDWTDCREFDCLVSPSHLCCSPHATEKRQTGAKGWQGGGPRVTVLSLPGFNSLVAPLVLEYPGRVTATVTRVEKSYSWSPWKKLDIIDNNL